MSDDAVNKIEIKLAVLTTEVRGMQKLVKLLLALVVISYVVDVEKILAGLKVFNGG